MRMPPPTPGPLLLGALGWPAMLLLYGGGAVLSALLARAMIRAGPLDTPGPRSAHAAPVPRGGGVGVMAAFLLGVPIAAWLHGGVPAWPMAGLLGGTALLAAVAWIDDVRQFPPAAKLLAQIVAISVVLWGIGALPAGGWGRALGFAWLLFATNALNFIDGLNGLAGGSMALCALFIGLTAASPLQQGAGCLLAAGLLGFLPFNMPRARLFLGDVGSQGAGLAVAALGLLRWQQAGHGDMLVMPLLLSGILYDVAFTLCRRALAGETLWQAHRGHLYQIASRSVMPAWMVALLHWAFVLWGGVLALALCHQEVAVTTAILLIAAPQLVWTCILWRGALPKGVGRG